MRALRSTTCSCGHGVLSNTSSSAVSCACVCDAGWGSAPGDLFASGTVYCNVSQSTLDAMGNPAVAAGATPASALSASGGGTQLTASGWALIVGVIVALVCLCCGCYRRALRVADLC